MSYPTGLTPILSPSTPKAVLTSPNCTWPCPIGVPCCIPGHCQDPHQNEIPMSHRHWAPYSVTWPSHDDHTTTCHPGHLVGGPGSWGFQPSLFSLHFHLIATDASLIALQLLHVCLLSFLTWRLTVCVPVSCLHPSLLSPHVDSHHSCRYCQGSFYLRLCLLSQSPIDWAELISSGQSQCPIPIPITSGFFGDVHLSSYIVHLMQWALLSLSSEDNHYVR